MSTLLTDHKAYNNALFKKYLPIYDFSEILLHSIRKALVKNFPIQTGTVLDVACGTGSQLVELAKKGFEVTGVDLSPDMLAKAQRKLRKYPTASLLCHDGTNTPFSTGEFTTSLISFGLHDMPEEIAVGILQEMQRVTKKGGYIIVVDYVTSPQHVASLLTYKLAKYWESKYYPDFVRNGLRYYMEKAGLIPLSSKVFYRGIAQMYICKNV